jgi:hypothetical protein
VVKTVLGACTFYARCAGWAAAGSIRKANVWFWVVGTPIVAIVGHYLGVSQLQIPDQPAGFISFMLVTVTVTWGGLFIIRCFWAPFHFYREAQDNVITLQAIAERLKKKPEVRESLGLFVLEGQELMNRCADERQRPPYEEFVKWAQKIEEFLRDHLDDSHIARFRTGAGLPLTANSMASVEHRSLWASLNVRLARLQEFIKEN